MFSLVKKLPAETIYTIMILNINYNIFTGYKKKKLIELSINTRDNEVIEKKK